MQSLSLTLSSPPPHSYTSKRDSLLWYTTTCMQLHQERIMTLLRHYALLVAHTVHISTTKGYHAVWLCKTKVSHLCCMTRTTHTSGHSSTMRTDTSQNTCYGLSNCLMSRPGCQPFEHRELWLLIYFRICNSPSGAQRSANVQEHMHSW